ncbi:MAG: hypothetical protein R6W77_04300 [Trueperaceae bacterium]
MLAAGVLALGAPALGEDWELAEALPGDALPDCVVGVVARLP